MSLNAETRRDDDPAWKPPEPWQLALSRFFDQAWVEILIGILIIASVLLTLFEFWLDYQLSLGISPVPTIFGNLTSQHLALAVRFDDIITTVFMIELTLRFLEYRSKRRFFVEYWLDIIAVLPIFRVFRSARALRLLRLFRLLRLVGVMTRLSSHFPTIFRRGLIDFISITGVILLSIAFGTIAILNVESSVSIGQPGGESSVAISTGEDSGFDLEGSFWFSLYTLFAGEPVPQVPQTLMGKCVAVFLMFMGMTTFAIFAGTVSAFMVDRLRVEGKVVDWDTLQDHIVICGWTPKTRVIITEYRASQSTRRTHIVVITELPLEMIDEDVKEWTNVIFIHDDFTKVNALMRAGIARAKTCLVLSDISGGRSEQDADARTILAALTVEKVNEKVYTCAELVNRSYASHLALGKVNDFVVSGEYEAHMLAQAAMNRGLVSVLGELMTYQHGNGFQRARVPESWVGKSFDEKLTEVREQEKAIIIAVHPVDGEALVNPQSYVFASGDEVVMITRGQSGLLSNSV